MVVTVGISQSSRPIVVYADMKPFKEETRPGLIDTPGAESFVVLPINCNFRVHPPR